MKVLILCSKNQARRRAFVLEQAKELAKLGVDTEFFFICGKGVKGYLKSVPSLHARLRGHHFDLVHAHYGLSGLVAILQRKVPVVVTFHGSDVFSWTDIVPRDISKVTTDLYKL